MIHLFLRKPRNEVPENHWHVSPSLLVPGPGPGTLEKEMSWDTTRELAGQRIKRFSANPLSAISVAARSRHNGIVQVCLGFGFENHARKRQTKITGFG
jgi:hypothetical protein